MIAFTDRAVEILARADAAARRFNPDARIRIGVDGRDVSFELADEPGTGDETVTHPAGFTVWVPPAIDGTVDVEEPHDRLVLRTG